MAARAELEVIFTDRGAPPAQPSPPGPPPDSFASQSGNQPEQSQPSSPPPGPVARPSATPSGPPATPSASTLTAAEAAELFEKFGLKPEQIGARVASDEPTPGGMSDSETAANFRHEQGAGAKARRRRDGQSDEDADLEARLAHQDEMHDILSPDEPDKPAKPPKPSTPPGGRRKKDDEAGIFQKAFAAAAEQGAGAIAGEVGSIAGPGAGALASSLAGSIGAVAAASGPAAVAIGTLAVGAGALAVGFAVLTNEVDKLKTLSGDVAGAVAANEVRQQMLMLRRADQIGPQLAKFETARGDINAELTETMTQATRVLLQLFQILEDAGVVEFTRDALQYAAAQGEVMTEALQFIKAIYDRDAPAVAREWEEVKAAMGKQNKAAMEFFRDSKAADLNAEDPGIGMLERQLANIGEGLKTGEAIAKVRKFKERADAFHGRRRA